MTFQDTSNNKKAFGKMNEETMSKRDLTVKTTDGGDESEGEVEYKEEH